MTAGNRVYKQVSIGHIYSISSYPQDPRLTLYILQYTTVYYSAVQVPDIENVSLAVRLECDHCGALPIADPYLTSWSGLVPSTTYTYPTSTGPIATSELVVHHDLCTLF